MIKLFINGEPWIIKDSEVVGMICCDCELRHEVEIDIDKKRNSITLTSFRNDFKTDKARKKEGIVLYRRKLNGKKTRKKKL